MTILFDGKLMADYFQIVLADVAYDPRTPERITDRDVRDRLLLAPGILVLMTARNMPVPLRVELHRSEPGPFIEAADHIVMGGLGTSGQIGIAGLTDDWSGAARASVPPGDLRAMVVSRGLGTLSEDGLDGQDRYEVHLWPGRIEDVRVLKQWRDGA